MHPCLDWSASEIARRIAAHEVSALEVCQAYIARCEQVQPQLNALVWTRFEAALQDAVAIDERIARSEPLGPLAGVPLTVKECFFVEGSPTTIGLTNRAGKESDLEREWVDDKWLHQLAIQQSFEDRKDSGNLERWQPHREDPRVRAGAEKMRRRTCPLVHQMKQAGGVLLGKTNVPQLMLWHECDNPVYGRTNNPWDLERTPGGSTGGEAALIAAHGSSLGLGTDMGGSMRVPAAWCGISALMPTARRVPSGGTLQNFGWLEAIALAIGPMARHVEDLDLLMRVLLSPRQSMNLRQRTDHEFAVPPLAWPDFRKIDVRGLRIGIPRMWSMAPSPASERAMREAAEALEAAGATVVDDGFFVSEMGTYLGLITADGGACLREISRGSVLDWRASRVMWLAGLSRFSRSLLVQALRWTGQQMLAAMVASGGPVSAKGFGELIRAQQQAKYMALSEWNRYELDAIIVPPHLLPAPQHGKPIDLVPAAEPAYYANLLGWPAGVVPVTTVQEDEQTRRHGKTRDRVLQQAAAVDAGSAGLPVGVQVIARPWREDIVLAVMAAIERALPRPICPFLR